jgi:hypothetical protein
MRDPFSSTRLSTCATLPDLVDAAIFTLLLPLLIGRKNVWADGPVPAATG